MSDYAIKGSTVPMNLTVLYGFPFTMLQESLHYFSGHQDILLSKGEDPVVRLPRLDDFKFKDSLEEAQHIRVLLTYIHEQFHLRHLTASPIGLLLYMLGGRQYANIYSSLRGWGERMGRSLEVPVRLPLATQHTADVEIQEIQTTQRVFSIYQALLMDSLSDMTLLEAASQIMRPLMEEVKTIASGALGSTDPYPAIDLGENYNETVNPAGLTGRAVLEGLARMNELMTLGLLGVPIDTINEIVVEKQHGIYGQTIGIAGTLLNVRSTQAWMLVAKLSDWAMQAPVLPFLLRGRESVSIMELLPAWRYMLLVSRFKQSGFKVKDLLEREREVAAQIFGSLGWNDPWQVANSILQTDIPSPKSALTRHYMENLRLGAELRLSNPAVMSFPELADQGHRLQAVFNVFADEINECTAGKLTGDMQRWSLIESLVSDAVADALLRDKDLTRAFRYAQLVSNFYGGVPTPGALLGKTLVQCLGQFAAKRVLEATGWV